MSNVVDTKLYDLLGVQPGASENELKKVSEETAGRTRPKYRPGGERRGGGAGVLERGKEA